MKYIVTGGYGFIGSNLVDGLTQEGHQIGIADDMSTGNINNIPEHIRNIIRAEVNIDRLAPKMGDDVGGIFHLGMPSSSPMYKDDRNKIKDAIEITLQVFEYAKKYSIPVVYASSSSLYNGQDPPHMEDMEIYPRDFYTEARLFVERIAHVYSELYGVRSVGLRLFSVYGKNETYKGKYANTLTQFFNIMKSGGTPVIYGDGEQTRDFTHVSDVVEAFKLAMKYCATHDGAEIFNIGTGEEITFNDTVRQLNIHLGEEIAPEYAENPIKNYVMRTKASIIKAEEMLGFKAKKDIEKGIRDTYQI